MENAMNLRITEGMEQFNELTKLVKKLDKEGIWAYMLEIATIIDGNEKLSDEQKADAFNLASTKFENYDDSTVGANIFAEAAIETVLDERYADISARLKSFEHQEDFPDDIVMKIYDDFDDLFIEKLSSILG